MCDEAPHKKCYGKNYALLQHKCGVRDNEQPHGCRKNNGWSHCGEPVEVVYKKTTYRTVYEPKTYEDVSYEKEPYTGYKREGCADCL